MAVSTKVTVTLLGITNDVTPPPPAKPTVTSLSPSTGNPGDSVTVIGTGFDGATAVNFGSAPAEFSVANSTSITATVPDGTGAVNVSVVTPNGTSSESAAFTYGVTTPLPVNPKYTLTKLNHDQTPNMPELVVGSNDGGATVRQEVWNPDPNALKKQVTEVWSPSKWRTTINAAANNTAVNSYPDVSSLVTDVNNKPIPVANYASIKSSWSVDCHETPKTDAQAAYDIWLKDYDLELMIWVDTHGADRQPAGNDTGIDVDFDGVTYRLWAESDNSTISFVRKENAQQGSIDILAVIQYLIDAGRYPATVGVNMFCFGFETPSTGGVDEVFEVKDYTLVTTAKTGKTI